jgi:PAS domain S-box-containing protein
MPPVHGSPALEESAEELYENAPCGYLSTLPNGVIVKANQTFLTWMGYTRAELLAGMRFQDLLTRGGQIFHGTHYVPLLQLQEGVSEINFELVSRSGRRLPVLVNTSVKKDAEGHPLFHRTTVFNISDRKHYERELVLARKKAEEAARAKADFLSMMSHEIRTPMNAIIGLSNLLAHGGLASRKDEYLQALKASSENLLNLLNNILDFSKMEAGKATLEARGFDLRQLLQGIRQGLGVKADEKQLAVRMELDDRIPACLIGDPVKLGQVLSNLLSNAIKFTAQGGVTVAVQVRELSREDVSLDFRVSDTGIGIPKERLARVFEEFTQASDDIHQKYGGTGLGLTISQKLLELHGTRMHVESEPGRGSTFSFNLRLKLGQAEAPSAEPVWVGLDATTLQGVRVLVAEDHDLNVFVLSQFLRNWGVDFDVTADGQTALERLQAADYDLVLMDVQMPRMDGFEVTRAVRALPDARYQRLPIVALTASARMELTERLDAAGFSGFLGKPFTPEALFTTIAMHSARLPGAPAPLAEAPRGHVEDEAGPATPPRFDLTPFWDLVEGDAQALQELGTLAVDNAEKCKPDFQRALESANAEAFEFHAHKMKMTLELMRARDLEVALDQGRAFLAEGAGDSARQRDVTRSIHQEVDALIGALRDELRRVSG